MKENSERFPHFYTYIFSDLYFKNLLEKGQVGLFFSCALESELEKALPELPFKDIQAITEQLGIDTERDDIFGKIIEYMRERIDFCFGNKKLRKLLNEFHNFRDYLLLEYPFLDIVS